MLAELKSLLPPPVDGPARPQSSWAEAEESLGVRFPDGYKDVLDTYGMGTIDGELTLFDPRHIDFYWKRIEPGLTALRESHDRSHDFPLPGYPARGRRSLLMIGGNGHGDDLHLTVEDDEAHEDQLWIVNYRGLDSLQVPGPLSAFLVDVLTRTGSYERVFAMFGDIWKREPIFEPSAIGD